MRKLLLLLILFILANATYDLWTKATILLLDGFGYVLGISPTLTGFAVVLFGCVFLFFIVRKVIRWLRLRTHVHTGSI